MVRLHVKKGTESQFLYETTLDADIDKLIEELTYIYNGRLKVSRICYELEELVKHGTFFPPEILGLTEEQVEELHLVDEWGEKCVPSGGWTLNKDPIGRRNGHQPTEAMQNVINKTMDEAKKLISKKQVDNDVCVTLKMVQSALDMLRGAVTIVYPMGLPPHDPIRQEFENNEDLSGTQASLDVLEAVQTTLWFSGKEMMRGKKLTDYLGKNEKTKMIVKLQKSGLGAPQREPVMSEEEQKAMMLHAYRRQEELKDSEPVPLTLPPTTTATPVPPPTSGALTPASEVFREDLASFGHDFKVAMADEASRESVATCNDAVPNSNSIPDGNLTKTLTTSISTPPGPIAAV